MPNPYKLDETRDLDRIPVGPELPTEGVYLTHLWYIDDNSHARHEAGQLTDSIESELSELTEVLGIEDAKRARFLRPGQQAIRRTGQGPRERTRLIHRIW